MMQTEALRQARKYANKPIRIQDFLWEVNRTELTGKRNPIRVNYLHYADQHYHNHVATIALQLMQFKEPSIGFYIIEKLSWDDQPRIGKQTATFLLREAVKAIRDSNV